MKTEDPKLILRRLRERRINNMVQSLSRAILCRDKARSAPSVVIAEEWRECMRRAAIEWARLQATFSVAP